MAINRRRSGYGVVVVPVVVAVLSDGMMEGDGRLGRAAAVELAELVGAGAVEGAASMMMVLVEVAVRPDWSMAT